MQNLDQKFSYGLSQLERFSHRKGELVSGINNNGRWVGLYVLPHGEVLATGYGNTRSEALFQAKVTAAYET